MDDTTPPRIEQLLTPCFLVDIEKVRRNCQSMIHRCEQMGVQLRPHMKTHKTLEGGFLMTNGTRRRVVVSTVDEAEFFADGGYDDILYGVVFTADKIKRCKALAERLEKFHVFIDSKYTLNMLQDHPLANGKKWSVFLKVNCGYQRAGVRWDDPKSIAFALEIAAASDVIHLEGVYCFDGMAYQSRGDAQLQATSNTTAERVVDFKNKLKEAGIECNTFSYGSTPSCSKPGHKTAGVTEFHPGNYVFYDAQNEKIGSCTDDDIAVRVATRVIGHYPEVNGMLIDCGFLALSQDGKNAFPTGYCRFQGHPELKLHGMTQEVGKVEGIDGPLDYSKYPIGSLLFIYPHHSCATAAMHAKYYIHSGDKIVDVWKPTRCW